MLLSKRKVILLFIIFLAADTFVSFYSGIVGSYFNRPYNPVINNIEIMVNRTEVFSANKIAVYRLSLRNNIEKIDPIYKNDGSVSWIIKDKYCEDVFIEFSDNNLAKSKALKIVIGNKVVNYKNSKVNTIKLSTIFSYNSIFPYLKNVVNYRGDLAVIIIHLIRALTIFSMITLLNFIKVYRQPVFKWVFLTSVVIVGLISFIDLQELYRNANTFVSDFIFVLYPRIISTFLCGTLLLILTHKKSIQQNEYPIIFSNRKEYIFLTVLFLCAFFLRMINYNYLQGGDIFNLISALALNDTGEFHYPRNIHFTLLISWLFSVFGKSLFIARLPFSLMGALTVYPVYKLFKQLSIKIAFIGVLLLTLSPWAIEKSTQIRDYTVNLFIGAIVYYLTYKVFQKYRNSSSLVLGVSIGIWIIFTTIFLYYFSTLFSHQTVLGVVQVNLFFSAFLFFIFLWKKHSRHNRFFIASIFGLLVLTFLLLVHRFPPFTKDFGFIVEYFGMFIDPMIDTPVQWFSHQRFTIFTPLLFMSLPLLDKNKKWNILRISIYATFIATVLLFGIKTSRFGSRFLFHLLPFYIFIIADGIDSFIGKFRMVFFNSSKYRLMYMSKLALVFFLVAFIYPYNTIHAVKHDLPNQKDNRKITKLAQKDIYYEIEKILRKNGATNKSIILADVQRPETLTWLFSQTVNRTYNIPIYNDTLYDIGNNIFFISDAASVNQLDEALEYERGFFVAKNKQYSAKDFIIENKEFNHIKSIDNYNLYKWSTMLEKERKN
ncbi:MAG: glycosyltransferase family 39 protein [Spirochaetia bacterium]|nr:glycosyltransferase family 39 protein [Spirochaetia bacterium]